GKGGKVKDKVGPISKGKEVKAPKPKPPKEGMCFHCNNAGHWKRNWPAYSENPKKKGGGAST
ncbi:unnamed protein product, partial [Dovyalis caffra]